MLSLAFLERGVAVVLFVDHFDSVVSLGERMDGSDVVFSTCTNSVIQYKHQRLLLYACQNF